MPPSLPRRAPRVGDRAPRQRHPRPHSLPHRICVDVGDLPLGVEGDDRAGATPAGGDAPARDGQEPRGLELQHGAQSSAVSGGEQRVVNLPSISLGPWLFVYVSLTTVRQFGTRGEGQRDDGKREGRGEEVPRLSH